MTGVIDVGGGLRDIFGAGVLDECLTEGIEFDYCAGVSAGAANLSSYLAHQRGRNFSFYTEYAFREEYMSLKNLFHTGSYIDLDYVYGTLSNRDGENPLDYEEMCRHAKRFVIVATDARTGRPVYFTEKDLSQDHYEPVCASSCVPVLNQPYPVRSRLCFDGGMSDPIPVRKAAEDGCDRIVLILTRPRDFYRSPGRDRSMAKLLLKKYPNAARALAHRSEYYNRSLELCKMYEKEGKVLILAPDSIGNMGTLTRDRETLLSLYHAGLEAGKKIRDFLEG